MTSTPHSTIEVSILFISRDLSWNKLDGTIPAVISALVKLTDLCDSTFFSFSAGQLSAFQHFVYNVVYNNVCVGINASQHKMARELPF